ncbi:hypothetical protein D3C87_1046070 [compost metagenome]
MHFAVQDRLEFIGEGVVAAQQGFAASGETVVSDYGRDRGEQTDRSSDQSFGDTRGHSGQGCLLGAGQTAEGVHDAPHGTEQTDVRTDRTDSGEERQALLQFLFFAGNGDAHGTGHTFHDRFRVDTWLLTQTGELLEAGTEDLLHTRIRVRVAARLTVQLGQVDTRPEALFEALQGASTGAQQIAALKDHDP